MYCADHADSLEAKVNAELYANRQANAQAHVEGSNGAVPAAASLRFITAAELHERTPEEVEWIWDGYIATGELVLLAGKPKAGKSTLACAWLVAAAHEADEFLGRKLNGGPVVYVAEEGDQSVKEKIPPHGNISLITRRDAWPKPAWEQVIDAAANHCKQVGARALMIDTLGFWAGFQAEREQDSGATQRVLDALHRVTLLGVAVVLVHHQKKGGGEEGEAVRGSSAIVGAVDVVLELERLGEDAPVNQRRIVALSRHTDTPDVLIVDRDPQHAAWGVIGVADSRATSLDAGWTAKLLDALPPGIPGATLSELEGTMRVDRRKWHRTLKAMADDGRIEHYGEGKRNDPHRYYLSQNQGDEWPF